MGEYNFETLLRIIKQWRKMRFFGHIIRKGSLERCIIEGKVEGKRRRGMPLTSPTSDLAKLVGGSFADSVHQAVDREGWCAN